MMQKDIIVQFYEAFVNGDAKKMGECYSEDVVFEDPAFGILKGQKAKMMWQMLLSKKDKSPKIEFKNVELNGNKGKAEWTARYKYGEKNRNVINNVFAEFHIENGKIINHKDTFNVWKWSKQALGLPGLILGWTPFMKNKIQDTTNNMLKNYIKSQQ